MNRCVWLLADAALYFGRLAKKEEWNNPFLRASHFLSTSIFARRRRLIFTLVFLARNSKLRYNKVAEGSCQSESEAKFCIEQLTGTR